MYTIPRHKHIVSFSAQEIPSPAASIRAGECITFDTADGLMGRSEDIFSGRFKPAPLFANPATGPLFVEGAEPGDVLRVDILDIRCDADGYVGLRMSRIGVCAPENEYVRVPLSDGQANLGGVLFKQHPMIGTIGVMHPEGRGCTEAGVWGGNMDASCIKKGTVLLLPVTIQGGLLAMGDFHALQGDGEMFGQGIETGGQADVNVSVLKRLTLPGPVAIHDGNVSLFWSDPSFQTAANAALLHLGQLLIAQGASAHNAALLLAAKGELRVREMVNPQLTVSVSVETEDLSRIGVNPFWQ